MYPNLFSPIFINKLELKNRIAYPALSLIYSLDSKLNERYYRFFQARAQGGAGLVTVGPVGVDFLGSGLPFLSLARDEAIPDFAKVAKLIKEAGARAWVQLFHAGAYSHPFMINNQTALAPSPIFSNYSKAEPQEMTLDQIKDVQEAFTRTAERAREAGFDGVEIIGSAGYLITQFLSPKTNTRTDEYGGSFENRVRFPRELIQLMRGRLGPNFPITIRMAGNDFVPGGNTDTETPEFAKVYEQAGINAINVTGGWHESKVPQLPMHLPRSGFSYLALNIKQAVSIPVMASNRICAPDEAERILREGCADMVNLGRVLLADPEWPNKAKEGRAAEIRPCVACSQGCTDMAFKGKPVFCVANPFTGYEAKRAIPKADQPQKILVVGAGLAGLEAAVTATQMGHEVEIFDQAPRIGGQINLAGVPHHKSELLEFIRYYGAMIDKYNLPVHLNTKADLNLIQERNPDKVILAAGAVPLVPSIPGADGSKVMTAWQVLAEQPLVGPRVAVIGGGAVGLETGLFLAQRGTLTPEALHFLLMYQAESVERLQELMVRGSNQVTVFEMLPKVGRDVGPSTKWVLLTQLKKAGVKLVTKAQVNSIIDGKVEYVREDQSLSEEFDTIVLAVGVKPTNTLAAEMEQEGIPFISVGDCVQPGRIEDSIHGGFKAALEI